MTQSDNMRQIAPPQGFSSSDLWRLQRDYFDREGVDAWYNQVPFYVTSNNHIAASYAKITLALMDDWRQKNPDQKDVLFNIIELGTGSGQFSYYFLSQMQRLQSKTNDPCKFRYILTDFTASNLQFWRNNPQFKPFVDQGLVDFALFDMEQDTELNLVCSGEKIAAGSLHAPLIIIGNYIFDTVSTDAFAIQEGKPHEVTLKLSCAQEELDQNNMPKKLEHLHLDYGVKDIRADFFHDPKLNSLLQEYSRLLPNSYVSIPTAGIRALNSLASFSESGMLLISSDKSYTDLEELAELSYPGVAFHGSFSLMVNYDAIVRYFEAQGATAILPEPDVGLRTLVLAHGFDMQSMPTLVQQSKNVVEQFTPEQFFNIYRTMKRIHKNCSLQELIAYLDLSCCDPRVFNIIAPSIYRKCSVDIEYAQAVLPDKINHVLDNFYFMANDKNMYFNIGLVLHGINDLQSAEEYYLKSLERHPDNASTFYNLALTAQQLRDDSQEVDRLLDACLEIDPNFELARKMREP